MFAMAAKTDLNNYSKYIPALVVLLIIAAFFIGSLTTKVSLLQNGTGTGKANEQAGVAPTQGAPAQADPNKKYDVSTGVFPVLGNKDAKVTIVEFSDFQCPFCEKYFTDSESQIIKEYVDTGKAKFAFRNYAFLGSESTFAAEAATCANDQGKFWEFHNYLYTHQGGENQGAFSKENLKKFAADLGLNTNDFNSCLDTDKHAKTVSDDLAAGQKVSVSGTPTTFVNGKILVGAVPYAEIKKLIDQELQAAK
jgi:protein-disulfide isomerase